jgi:hypothetical protein
MRGLKEKGGARATVYAAGAGAVVDFLAQMGVGHVAWLQQNEWAVAVGELVVAHGLRYVNNAAGLGAAGLAGGRFSEIGMKYLAAKQATSTTTTTAKGLGQGFNPHSFTRQASRQLQAMNAGRRLDQQERRRVA